jgi:hypothetical protein
MSSQRKPVTCNGTFRVSPDGKCNIRCPIHGIAAVRVAMPVAMPVVAPVSTTVAADTADSADQMLRNAIRVAMDDAPQNGEIMDWIDAATISEMIEDLSGGAGLK